jgi:hypothetical protein
MRLFEIVLRLLPMILIGTERYPPCSHVRSGCEPKPNRNRLLASVAANARHHGRNGNQCNIDIGSRHALLGVLPDAGSGHPSAFSINQVSTSSSAGIFAGFVPAGVFYRSTYATVVVYFFYAPWNYLLLEIAGQARVAR